MASTDTLILGCPSSDSPNILHIARRHVARPVWRFRRSEACRGLFISRSDDRLVLRSPQAQPPVAIAIKADVEPAFGIEFVLGESVKQVDEGAEPLERPAVESTRCSYPHRSCAARPSPSQTSPGIRGPRPRGWAAPRSRRRPADLRLLPVRIDEVAHEPPEGLVVVALVGGVDTLRAVEAIGEGTGKPAFWALENPPLSPAVHCMGVRTASRPGMSRCSAMPISSP